tara:strand:- start:54 stop:515 length:462 start_codon:yes stop_codon:yes gene_type:complete
MSKRFQTTFIKVVVDEGEDDVEFFQPLTPQQSARRLMQTTAKLHRRVTASRDLPTALRERTNFSEIIRKQKQALAELDKQIKRKGSMRIRGIELAKKLKFQGIGSASNKPSSPSKGKDFGEVMEHEKIELTQFREAVTNVIRKLRQKKTRGFG